MVINKPDYSFEKSLVFGSLPKNITLKNDNDRSDFIKAYSHIYLEEEIRAESLSRKIGAFSRFLELAAQESGTSPNFNRLSMESGVSAPAVKEFYNLLVDTLIVERIEPYTKRARKRLLTSPRFYFFDLGVRNAICRLPLTKGLINTQKGVLFEHAVMLEIIRRIRLLNKDYRVNYWRTSAGAEVDCIIDLGNKVIPIEIKASKRVGTAQIKGLINFLDDYPKVAKKGYVITMGSRPEKLTDKITLVPWQYL
ncbi:ATP-binding protein [Candidatus Margulisiibacteriota bacterium]